MDDLRLRIQQLLQQLNERVFGKEHVIALSLLSAVAGESIFLLGPPGVAKSMVARRLKLAFRGGEAFEYLMSRFSTPDEIFGPVSISKLKEGDTYERVTEGYLPSSTVVFLDEIWKAGPAIQNALLMAVNEKIFRNGRVTMQLPLKGLVAASNELPAVGQGLEALWDRFLLRVMVTGVEDLSDFDRMIASADESEPCVPEELAIGDEEYSGWQQQIAGITLHYSIFEVIHLLKEKIEDYNRRLQNDESAELSLYVSDRRWKKMIKLLRASAFLNGSEAVRLSDCLLLAHCLWSDVTQKSVTEEMLGAAIRQSAEGYLLNLQALKEELMAAGTVRESHDPGLMLVDSYYYQIERVRLAGRLLMFASDFQSLDDTGKLFYLHKDKYKSQCFILKKYDLSMRGKVPQNKIYSLRKGRRSVFINNYEYPLRCNADAEPLPAIEVRPENDLTSRFRGLEELLSRVDAGSKEFFDAEREYCRNHLFLSEQERRKMDEMLRVQQDSLEKYKHELDELKHAYRKENEEYPDQGSEGDLFGGAPAQVL